MFIGCEPQFRPRGQQHGVQQLHLLPVPLSRQRAPGFIFGIHQAAGQHLFHGNRLQGLRHRVQCRRGRLPAIAQRSQGLHHPGRVVCGQGLQPGHGVALIDHADHRPYRRRFQPPLPIGQGLVGQGQGVPHRTASRATQHGQGGVLIGYAFGLQHARQVLLHRVRRHRAQVELKTAAEHRRQHLFGVGGGQHELQVLGRLFQRLEQGVEGVLGELVRLVDHEHLEPSDGGLVGRTLQQVADLIDAPVAGRVKLNIVHIAVGVDFGTGRAAPAGMGSHTALPVLAGAIQALGQDARDGGLANAARTGEEVGMVQPSGRKRRTQRPHHGFLSHHLVEGARTVLAGEHNIGHRWILCGGAR